MPKSFFYKVTKTYAVNYFHQKPKSLHYAMNPFFNFTFLKTFSQK
uniref:Uncharacterized protein n=1 Tax=viral metagenome TaxID=1070528 RepID=A0A6C0IKR9_9ZZZZ